MTFEALGIPVRPKGPVEQRVPCPLCKRGHRDTALGANIVTGVFQCFRCGYKGRVVGGAGAGRDVVPIADSTLSQRKLERLRRTWRETVPLSDSSAHAVRSYLCARALDDVVKDPPRVLRAHPGLDYWEGTRSLGKYPAMVALFHDAENQPITLHVTYLCGCAKAPVPHPKKIMGVPARGATKGGAIHLYEPRGGVLGVAEGIESALSLFLIQRIPVWSCFCADNLAMFRLPAGIRSLFIGVDIDISGKGIAVARKLAHRVNSTSPATKVMLVKPEIPGAGDLNDELRRLAR